MNTKTDGELVEAAKSGCEESFEKLVLRYCPAMIDFAYRYLGDRNLAEDVSQEVFIKAYKKLGKCKSSLGFKNWLYRIALNTCRDIYRTKRYHLQRSAVDVETIENQSQIDGRDELYTRDHSQILENAIAKLKASEKAAIIFKYYQGMKIEEIAAVIKKPAGTVKSKIYYALKKLREDLKEINIQESLK